MIPGESAAPIGLPTSHSAWSLFQEPFAKILAGLMSESTIGSAKKYSEIEQVLSELDPGFEYGHELIPRDRTSLRFINKKTPEHN